MKKRCCLILATCLSISVFAQQGSAASSSDDYTRVLTQRAEKIIAPLHIASATADSVRSIIIQQYRTLNAIHEATGSDNKMAQLKKAHDNYLEKLAKFLTSQQVDQVKDGMTYSVLPATYAAYQDMLPQLTEEQKKQIYTWLLEAREFAMDAESSEKKHQWFGKYKGRINNYLSAAGIDLKKAEADWQQRIKERKKTEQ